jgi:hypothetical protein
VDHSLLFAVCAHHRISYDMGRNPLSNAYAAEPIIVVVQSEDMPRMSDVVMILLLAAFVAGPVGFAFLCRKL